MTVQSNRSTRWFLGTTVFLLSLIASALAATAMATDLEKDGQDVYDETCLLCHGIITEPSAQYQFLPDDGSEIKLAVITPRGPTLNGIVGRPVAIIPKYAYSKAMRKFGQTGAVWSRETLDQFLTDSRKFVKGSFMILKLAEQDRKRVLDYLQGIATYRP